MLNHKYHDSINPPPTLSLIFASRHAVDTMQNTIDDAHYIIDMTCLIIIIRWIRDSGHSHSMVNEHGKSFLFHAFIIGI